MKQGVEQIKPRMARIDANGAAVRPFCSYGEINPIFQSILYEELCGLQAA